MKKKVISYFLFGAIFSTNSSVYPLSLNMIVNNINDNRNYYRDVEIVGNLGSGKTRSSFKPVQVIITGSDLKINFFSTLGNIDIAVYDGSRSAVHHSNVNIQGDEKFIITTAVWSKGAYRIQFTDTSGNMMYGDFEIQ